LADWWAPAVRLASARDVEKPTYLYNFACRMSDRANGPGAIHGIDAPVFGTRPLPDGSPVWNADRLERVRRAHCDLFERIREFVITCKLDPSVWPAYSPAHPAHYRIDRSSSDVTTASLPELLRAT
jgi:carboxylesterase type B